MEKKKNPGKSKKTIEELLVELYDDKIINAGMYFNLLGAVQDKAESIRKNYRDIAGN